MIVYFVDGKHFIQSASLILHLASKRKTESKVFPWIIRESVASVI